MSRLLLICVVLIAISAQHIRAQETIVFGDRAQNDYLIFGPDTLVSTSTPDGDNHTVTFEWDGSILDPKQKWTFVEVAVSGWTMATLKRSEDEELKDQKFSLLIADFDTTELTATMTVYGLDEE